ncbi:AraC family transcriptional regulator [Novosphingobium sp. Rr 2-17]|uniref:AraC family transcriptional regulator n=1 Tax=Novosphingobium sp. Rr 2-17 TaxID=555793 RepID=UPI0002697ACE|nr:AraC family transcriptional regulator [Novosphingobium sp. Rr 2-17]EIZ81158.1 AraC family transcriptional regulator [Novosphingobium sp. Rr 2-17]
MKDDAFHVRSLESGAVTAVDAYSARSFARHMHDEFGVGLVTSGAQRSWSGRGPVEAVCGNLITVNPAELHDGAPIGSNRSWSMLYFSQRIVGTLVADLDEGRSVIRELHAPVVDDPRLAGLFVAVREAAIHPQGEPAFEERLLTLFGRLFDVVQRPAGLPLSRVSRVRERIADAPARPHALSELAALAGLSRYQTVRAFARLTGLTPHAYVMQRRLDMARTLIRQGSTLADAAVEAGFADQSHMHRIFVARHGFTPGAYASAVRRAPAISFKSVAARHH